MTDEKDSGSLRAFVVNAITEQFKGGNSNICTDVIVEAVLTDETMIRRAVKYGVEAIYRTQVNKLIRKTMIHQEDDSNERSGASRRLVAAVIDYGLALLDVHFGSKALGDYLPTEALSYAHQQHEQARKGAIQARFVASVAHACQDDTRLIREQLTNDEVEAIRKRVIETSPAKEAAEIALAVA